MDRATLKIEGENAGRLSMVVYLMLCTAAVLTFLCLSPVIPELAKGIPANMSSSPRGPMRKYTFPTVD